VYLRQEATHQAEHPENNSNVQKNTGTFSAVAKIK
jgi:hypothetical protein